MIIGAKKFGTAVEAASWFAVIMRVAQFLFFARATVWSKITFSVLGALLVIVAVKAGMRVS